MPRFRGFRRDLTVPIALILIALVGLAYLAPAPPPVEGRATAVDGDTIRIGGQRIRLLDIDAPELEQTCQDGEGKDWRCGETARREMIGLLADGPLSCAPSGRDVYGRTLAHCMSGANDIGEAMVKAGLAVADGGYFAEEAVARRNQAGIWKGSFIPPAEWRREHGGNGSGQNLFGVVRSWFR